MEFSGTKGWGGGGWDLASQRCACLCVCGGAPQMVGHAFSGVRGSKVEGVKP